MCVLEIYVKSPFSFIVLTSVSNTMKNIFFFYFNNTTKTIKIDRVKCQKNPRNLMILFFFSYSCIYQKLKKKRRNEIEKNP